MARLYFAFGSNMLTARLAARCPSAHPVGPATAPGWRLAFAKEGGDGSQKATLLAAKGRVAWGVVYRLPEAELADLDAVEGPGYRRDDAFRVRLQHGEEAAATYIARAPKEVGLPFDWYRDLMLAGAREHGLPHPLVEALAHQPVVTDPDTDRPGRLAALAALAAPVRGA